MKAHARNEDHYASRFDNITETNINPKLNTIKVADRFREHLADIRNVKVGKEVASNFN